MLWTIMSPRLPSAMLNLLLPSAYAPTAIKSAACRLRLRLRMHQHQQSLLLFKAGRKAAPSRGLRASSSSSSSSSRHPCPGLSKPPLLSPPESQIWDRLVHAYEPSRLVVQDISGGCGTMYLIEVTSARFRGMRELQQQRMVLATLKDLRSGWHGLQLRTFED